MDSPVNIFARFLALVAAVLAGCSGPAPLPLAATPTPATVFGADPWVAKLAHLGVEFVTADDSRSVLGPLPTSCPVAGPPAAAVPSHACTPGAISVPRMTAALVGRTVCGPTSSFRPPASATAPVKVAAMRAEHLSSPLAITELDHLVPLELCGASSTSNLWAEPPLPNATSTLNPKDKIESALAAKVRAGKMSASEAAYRIASGWTTALTGA